MMNDKAAKGAQSKRGNTFASGRRSLCAFSIQTDRSRTFRFFMRLVVEPDGHVPFARETRPGRDMHETELDA